MPAERGLFVSIDGPSGVGKSSTVALLSAWLTAAKISHQLTVEPTGGPIGALTRDPADMDGPTLACLYAADRHQHLASMIRPSVEAGDVVVTDRYVPSALVMQQLDGVPLEYVRRVNALTDAPDLVVILTADPNAVIGRLAGRGTHNRYKDRPDSTAREIASYNDVADQLANDGVPVLRVDTSTMHAAAVVDSIGNEITRLRTTPRIATTGWMKETA